MGMSLFDELFGSQSQEEPVEEPRTEEVSQDQDEWEEQMSEAELRLQKASYYRILLDDHLFEDQSNPICVEIEREMRQFVRTRLSVLLNLTSEKEPGTDLFSTQEVSALKAMAASFNAQEVAVLKALAAKIVSRPALMGNSPVKLPEPPKPVPQKPALKKRVVEAKKPAQKQAVVQKPVTVPPVQQKPNKQQPKAKKLEEATFNDGEIIKEGHNTYKIRWIEVPHDYEPPPGVGKVTKDDKTYKVLKMDITKPEPGAGYIPMPSPSAMSRITEMKAAEIAANTPGSLEAISNRRGDRQEI